MFEVVALRNLSDPAPKLTPNALFGASAKEAARVDSWGALVEALLGAVAEKRGAVTRGWVEIPKWTLVLDPTARTCLNPKARSYAEEDSGRAADLSVGRFLLCVWVEHFSDSIVLLCYRDGKPVRRLVVVGRKVELADGQPLSAEPANLADFDQLALAAVVSACHLDMDQVRGGGTFTLVTLAPDRRP